MIPFWKVWSNISLKQFDLAYIIFLLMISIIRCEFTDDLCDYQTRTTDELSRFLWQRKNSEQLIAENIPGPAGLVEPNYSVYYSLTSYFSVGYKKVTIGSWFNTLSFYNKMSIFRFRMCCKCSYTSGNLSNL